MKKNLKGSKSDSGVVLIIVLIATAILTTLVVDLIYFTQIDSEISANTRDDIKARYIAKSGINVVAGTMKETPLEDLKQITSLLSSQGGGSDEIWAIRVPVLAVGDGSVSLAVFDERSKINLNALVNQSSNRVDNQVKIELEELFRILEVDPRKSDLFIASLINWLDRPIRGGQNDQDSSGAGANYYLGLENPYNIKNGPLDSVDEIRMIRGMDEEFFGKIKDYVTVYPTDKKVNFSTASKAVMISALKGAAVSAIERQGSSSPEDLKDDIADRIAEEVIEARKDNSVIDRKKVREIINDADPTLKINAGIGGVVLNSGESDVFSVISSGIFGEENPTLRTVEAVIRKGSSGQSRGIHIISWKER
ncbi:MAG: general secretion pathway protein GspK [Deltaproteobacteria bacterium]|nr:general secretion pathway protein GspK [Deltaproteobacteria bacterium]